MADLFFIGQRWVQCQWQVFATGDAAFYNANLSRWSHSERKFPRSVQTCDGIQPYSAGSRAIVRDGELI